MKIKWIAAVCAASMLIPPLMPSVKAEPIAAIQTLAAGSLESVQRLTMDMVLDRGLTNSANLALLTLKYAAQGNKKADLETQRDELTGVSAATVHLPESPSEFSAVMPGLKPQEQLWLGPVSGTNKVLNQMMQGQAAMVAEVNDFLFAQREQMKSAAHQLESEQKNTLLQIDEAKEGIRLQLTSQYVQLLAYRKQLSFMDEYQKVLEREDRRVEWLKSEGLASQEDLRMVKKQLAKHKEDVASVTNQYQLGLIQLSFDLGMAYDPKLVLEDIALTAVASVVELDTDQLVQNSYAFRSLSNQLEEAQWQTESTVTQNVYGDAYLDNQAGIAAVKKSQARVDLSKKAKAVYMEAKQAYEVCLTEERNAADLHVDAAKMKARYEYGVISLYEAQKFDVKVKQGELALELARMKYFVVSKKAAAMERGLIV